MVQVYIKFDQWKTKKIMGLHRRKQKYEGQKWFEQKRKPMFDESGTTLLNGIKLNFEKGFGYNQDPCLKSNAYCIDDNRIIYVLSKQIVMYDLLAETQKVIDCFDFEENITAMLYFKNILLEDNIIFGIHCSNKSFPSVVIHNFSKNFTNKLMLANLEKDEKILELVLINDFRNIAVLSMMDQIIRVTIVEISTKEIKMFEYINFQPLGMLAPSQYPTHLIFYSDREVYITDLDSALKMTAISLRQFITDEDEFIVQLSPSLHMNFCLYAITTKGYLYFIHVDLKENQIQKVTKEFLGNYQTMDENGKQITTNRVPSCLCVNQYNILIGYEKVQEFTLVKICAVSNQNPYVEKIKFSCPFLHKIVRMSFAAQTMAVCVIVQVKENDKYDFSIPIQSDFMKQKGEEKIVKQNLHNHKLKPGKIFPIIFNLLLYDTLVQTLRSPIQTVLNSMLLIKKIIDIAILPTKKLIIILSSEKKIKAVKYEHVSSISFDRMLAWQMCFNMNDSPACLDVHPLTFVVAVGFKEGVKLFNIFSEGMRTTNIHFPLKNCESVKYAKFGHMLAAGSSHQILLINPYENRIVHSIQLGHAYTTKELFFIDKDMYLLGLFGNGSCQVMDLEGGRIFEVWNKTSKCICSCYDPVFDIMIMSYQDNEVKFYRERGEIQFAIMWTYPFIVTKILVVNQLGTAFMGTSTGKIRAYQWPFTDMIKFNKSFTEIQLHHSSVTQIKIVHDFSYIITGSEDGCIFISKITPYSDGMAVNDSSILHTFKVNKKNYTSLYYLQNYMYTNNSIQSEKQERIVQFESDKADFDNQYTCIIQDLQNQIEYKLREEEKKRKQNIKEIISPFDSEIEDLNQKKNTVKSELNLFLQKWNSEVQCLQQDKLTKMRQLYAESDHLKLKLNHYQDLFREDLESMKSQYEKELIARQNDLKKEEEVLVRQCQNVEEDYNTSLITYNELLKQEEEQGVIYKQKMMEKLETQYSEYKHRVEDLRKVYNKRSHEMHLEEDKMKYFQQLITEIEVDIDKAKMKREHLQSQMGCLITMLEQKDKQIFDEEKAVKQLLKKSINNYSHEEYLKHRQDELLMKAKFLQKQIEKLDEQYRIFQQNFVEASKDTNQYNAKIIKALSAIKNLKQRQRILKERNYAKKYQDHHKYTQVLECFHTSQSKHEFVDEVCKLLELNDSDLSKENEEKIEGNIGKRDHLIEKVINTNKLRKIDDTIKKTIMIKLNGETVKLTSEVNELRKEKKNLISKTKQLQLNIKDIRTHFTEKNVKENANSITEFVPGNISAIRSQNSKHQSPKLLPFQLYHQNKPSQRTSIHSKMQAKSIAEENSTQLPSIIKNSQSYSGSIFQQSSLEGVQEIEDEVAQ